MNSEKTVQIYVQLLEEGTPTARLTQALDLGHGRFKLLPTPNYNPENEIWEFLPGSIVEGTKTKGLLGEMLLAVKSEND